VTSESTTETKARGKSYLGSIEDTSEMIVGLANELRQLDDKLAELQTKRVAAQAKLDALQALRAAHGLDPAVLP